ncbi:Asparaginase/glutaminase, partial [Ilyonectria sp. MPI-CAGE-AT-0026]
EFLSFDPILPNITSFATGGTFAGDGPASKTTGYKAGVLNVTNIIVEIPGIFGVVNVRRVQYAKRDSINAKSEQDYGLSIAVQIELKRPTTQGVVVITRTDTLEERAFFLDLTVISEKPVTITGSARPHTAAIYDGGMNLLTAVVLAGDQNARDRGVMIVFSDRILSPRHATKINSNLLNLFEAEDAGNLGTFVNVQPVFYFPASRPLGHQHFDITKISPDAEWPRVLMAYGHQDPATAVFIPPDIQGLVLVGLGAGYWPSAQEMRKTLNGTGIPVVVCSRVPWGFVSMHNIDFGIGAGFL